MHVCVATEELEAKSGMEYMRFQHEYETLTQHFTSRHIYRKVVDVVPRGKEQLSPSTCSSGGSAQICRVDRYKCVSTVG